MKKESQIVFNLDHNDYSEIAINIWESNGYVYRHGSLKELNDLNDKDSIIILIVRLSEYIDKKIVDKIPNLKYLLTATTGLNHINIYDIDKRKIKIINLRGQTDFLNTIPSTAEFTWALMLNLLRSVSLSSNDVINGNWDRDKFKGFELKGKTLGIVGLGRIGKMVSKYGLAFGMNVVYSDPNVIDKSLESCSLEELAKKSDILSLHIHADKKNKKIINSRIIKLISKGSYIINTSRGEIWDEKEIYNNIKNEKLGGIATDVITNENIALKESILWKNRHNPKILITPHLGGATYDAMWKCELKIQEIFFQYVNMH